MEQTAIAEEAARWAVEAWGLALGVLQVQPARKNAVAPPPVPKAARPRRTPPPPPPPPVPAQVTTPVPVQVYPIRRERPRSRLLVPVILPLIFTAVVLGVLAIIFKPFWGRQKPSEAAPTPFDTELALLPGDCKFLVSVDLAGLTRSMGESPSRRWRRCSSRRKPRVRSPRCANSFRLNSASHWKRSSADPVRHRGREQEHPRVAFTLTFAGPLDAAAVQKCWSEGVTRTGYQLLKPREKKLVQQRTYWLFNGNGAFIYQLRPTGNRRAPRTQRPRTRPHQAARACVGGDHRVIEKLLAPNRSHLAAGSPTTLLNRTDFKKALVAGWAGRDALQALKNSVMPPGAEQERRKQVTALFEGAEEAVGRLDLRDDRPRINLIVTYTTDTNARQAEEAIRALVKVVQDSWNKEGKKQMVDSLAMKNDKLRPQSETFYSALEQGLSFAVTRDGRMLDVSLRLDRSPTTVLTEMASLKDTVQRETDEETRRRLPSCPRPGRRTSCGTAPGRTAWTRSSMKKPAW